MSTTVYLRHAQRLLETALEQARQERDRAVFELARGSAACSSCCG
jgi:cell division protein FtsL